MTRFADLTCLDRDAVEGERTAGGAGAEAALALGQAGVFEALQHPPRRTQLDSEALGDVARGQRPFAGSNEAAPSNGRR